MITVVIIGLFIELISYISSLRAFRLDMPVLFKQFSFFLLFIVLVEGFAFSWSRGLYKYTSLGQINHSFYNIFHFLIYLFYLYFFHSVLKSPGIKYAIKIISAVYIVFVMINLVFGQGLFVLNSYTELFNTFIMVFLSISYYYQLLKAEEIVPVRNDLVFWISTGVLIHHLASMMSLFMINIINAFPKGKSQGIYLIVIFSAMVMYLCFTIGFLWTKKK
jgi:hypothetical protein